MGCFSSGIHSSPRTRLTQPYKSACRFPMCDAALCSRDLPVLSSHSAGLCLDCNLAGAWDGSQHSVLGRPDGVARAAGWPPSTQLAAWTFLGNRFQLLTAVPQFSSNTADLSRVWRLKRDWFKGDLKMRSVLSTYGELGVTEAGIEHQSQGFRLKLQNWEDCHGFSWSCHG